MGLNYYFPAQLKKSGKESNGRIPVEIIPSEPTVDRVNDKIILKAFEEARDDFLDEGIIDYDHKSVLGKNDLEKAQAIIGEPEDLYIDKERKIPVCHAVLFKGNPYVDTVIMPVLNNGSKIFGASVGGKILHKSFEMDSETKREVNQISKILLKHIAITPRQKAVHPRTSLKLLKSFGEDDNLIMGNFDDFMKSIGDEEMIKTLTAGAATDIANISGGQALQIQSLEGSKVDKNKIKDSIPWILDGIRNQYHNNKTVRDWTKYLVQKGFTPQEALITIQLLAKNKAQIVELI
jgi:hypothetical protein